MKTCIKSMLYVAVSEGEKNKKVEKKKHAQLEIKEMKRMLMISKYGTCAALESNNLYSTMYSTIMVLAFVSELLM